MTKTLKERRDDLALYAGMFGIPMSKIDNPTLDMATEYGKRRVFLVVFKEQAERFIPAPITFSDGDPLPDGFIAFTRRARKDANTLAGYIPASKIPTAERNLRVKAAAARPVYTIANRQVRIFPDTETIDIWYFKMVSACVADGDTDEMHDKDEGFITRAGYEWLVRFLQRRKLKYELTTQEIASMKAGYERHRIDTYQKQTENANMV